MKTQEPLLPKVLIVLVIVLGAGLVYFLGAREKQNEKNFKAIFLGQTEAEVVKIMGSPDYAHTKPGSDLVAGIGPLKAGEKDLFWLVSPESAKALGVRIGQDGRVALAIKEITVRKPR